MITMLTIPNPAAEAANAAIRAYRAPCPTTTTERTEYERLVGKRLKAAGGVVLAA